MYNWTRGGKLRQIAAVMDVLQRLGGWGYDAFGGIQRGEGVWGRGGHEGGPRWVVLDVPCQFLK